MADENRKREPETPDPVVVEKLLELELMQKRAAWQQAKARRGGFRALSFLFLFLIIVGAIVAFFAFFSPDNMSELKETAAQRATPAASATATPR